RGARPLRGHRSLPRPEPRLRRDSGGAHRGDRHRARCPPAALPRLARPGSGRRMKALLLAAGYATRPRPPTDQVAKPPLPVAERPMADWILDRIEESGEIDGVHVVTNAVYAPAFDRWAADRGVTVHDDGTSSNETRLGALGDIRLAAQRGGLGADGLLVIAA